MVGPIAAGIITSVVSTGLSTLIGFITGVVKEKVKELLDVEDNMKELQSELKWLLALLKDASAKAVENDRRVRACIDQLQDIVFEAEDCVDSFALEHQVAIRNNDIKGIDPIKLNEFAAKLKDITSQVTTLKHRLDEYGVKDLVGKSSSDNDIDKEEPLPSYAHLPGPEGVVGLAGAMGYLVDNLIAEGSSPVISICGMSGLGKTTLARKIYKDARVRSHFKFVVWVYVSKECKRRKVWRKILFKIMSTEERKQGKLEKLMDDELSKMIYKRQKEEKVLVVLDDIWSVEDWAVIRAGFPLGSTSKILLTSCNQGVAEFIHSKGFIFELGLLSKEDSWKLFQNKTKDLDMNERKEKLAKEMVESCGGLPLGILVLGRVLQSFSDWESVHENLFSYMKKGRTDEGEKFSSALASSYYSLPNHLKPCFLYMGIFPADISVERLINLWVAEGIVFPKLGQDETLEDVAYNYLSKLEKWNMIQVDKTTDKDTYGRSKIKKDYVGRIETCRLHPLLRQLCLVEAVKEGIFRPIDVKGGEVSLMGNAEGKTRRIAMYFTDSQQSFKVVDGYPSCRSILSFATYEITHEDESLIRSMIENSKLLRVLDLEGTEQSDIPPTLGETINLRYLNLKSASLSWLDESVGKLKNLWTLNLEGKLSSAGIPDVISALESLRHLYLPTDINGDKTKKLKFANLINLQTLINFPTRVADLKDLKTLISLRKLSIRIHDQSSFDTFKQIFTENSFNNLCSLSINRTFSSPPSPEVDIPKIVSHCPRLCVMTVDDEVYYPKQ